MRIVHVSDCYAPRLGGIESQVRDLARNQVLAGHEVHVITATPAAEGGSTRNGVEFDAGIKVHRIDAAMPFDLPVNPKAPALLRSLLHAINPEIVHVQAGMVSPVAFDGVREANALRIPVLITWHCMLNGIRSTLRAGIAATGWDREPIALSAVSVAAADQVATAFGGYCDVGVVPNGIDIEQWKSRTAVPFRAVGRPLRIVATMRLAPRKRVVPLLRLLRQAAKFASGTALQVTIIGSGPMEANARRYARRHAMDWVEFRGRVPREELRHIYASAEAFVAPAVLESFGIAALEARTAGLAVIARQGTGVQEFIQDGIDGLIVDSDEAMARAIARLALEPQLVEGIRQHNRMNSPAQSWERVVRIVDIEYLRAIGLRENCESVS